jgi:uncharacterized Fe-S cluster-containing MiaB family protein
MIVKIMNCENCRFAARGSCCVCGHPMACDSNSAHWRP